MEELENELANSLTELEKASDNILTLRNENGDLRDEIEKLKEDLRIDGKGDAQNEALKQEALAMLEGELAGAIENLEQANIQINNLLNEKNELTLQLSENKLNSSSKDQEKIKLLEDKLEESLLNLAELEKKSSVSPTFDKTVEGEAIQRLETDLAKSEATVSELQEKLTKEKQDREKLLNDFKLAGEQISKIEASKNNSSTEKNPVVDNDLEAYKLLEEQLVTSQLEVEALRQRNEAEEQGRVALEERLDKAISMIAQSKLKPSDSNSVVSPDVADLKEEIRNKNSNLSDLKKQLDMAIEELALKESELEILQATIPQSREAVPNESEEITMLTQEIASLKDSLAKAKTDAAQSKPDLSEISSMQEQLQNAVADGLELQAELEETRKRMQGMEQQLASSNAGQYDQLIKQAKNAEQMAFDKIQDLTAALRRSEELRKETENLLEIAQNQTPESPDVTKDPRYQELEIEISSLKQELLDKPVVNPNQELAKQEELKDLQEEMRLLQQDLLNARNLEDPMVADLQRKLELSREDAQKLNIEFKNAMEEFGKIKDQVTSLENENARLRDVSLNVAKNEADQQNKVLQNRINNLSNENSNLSVELGVKENRLTELREQLAQAQAGIPGLTADSAALKAQIIRLEGMLQAAQDNRNKSTFEVDALKQQLAFAEERSRGLEEQLRNTQSQLRNLPARLPNLSAPAPVAPVVGIPITPSAPSLSTEQLAELSNLRQENQRLQSQLVSLSNRPDPDRALLDQKIRDLNQRNMSAQVQLDQERAQVASLSKELADARNIKQEVLDRGRSAAMKVELLNDELANARNRMQSLEKALIGAREAIRVLRSGGNSSNTVQVSLPQNKSVSTRVTPLSGTPINRNQFTERPVSPLSRFGQPQAPVTLPNSSSFTSARNIPEGDASFSMKVEVQFLNNRNRPAGFTEFFLVDRDLDQVLAEARIRLPANEGIGSYAEYWARSVQRGYRFPGAAASIRNALANESVLRIKTNSLGEANIENVKAGRYFLVGASTLGQVGVVWSKPIDLSNGVNDVSLSLRDAAWAE